MVSPEKHNERMWRCLHCRKALTPDRLGLRCAGCGKQYPAVAGVTVLVSDPAAYLRSEIASLNRALRHAKNRRDTLDRLGRIAGLPDASIDRHRDVILTEIARAKTFRAMLAPAAKAIEALPGSAAEVQSVRRSGPSSGWALDTLLPYLMRDWTNTSELQAANSMIAAALAAAFPDPSGKSVVFAGCGAGGLLAEISPVFDRVLGFDLTFTVLAAARRLLDGETIDLALPRSITEAGHVRLSKRDPAMAGSHIELFAMDALDTAFADGSIDCVITSFLTDLMPDPHKLADEIHRILSPNGFWINYGPSGPMQALWRFDQTESDAFFESAGFALVASQAHRTTNLDLSRAFPSWSFRSHICYLTSTRKTAKRAQRPRIATPGPAEIATIVPQQFPGAHLTQRQSLAGDQACKTVLRHERIPGRMESFEINGDTAEILTLVDGKRTVSEIADLLKERVPTRTPLETISAFARYFDEGLLSWNDQGR